MFDILDDDLQDFRIGTLPLKLTEFQFGIQLSY